MKQLFSDEIDTLKIPDIRIKGNFIVKIILIDWLIDWF